MCYCVHVNTSLDNGTPDKRPVQIRDENAISRKCEGADSGNETRAEGEIGGKPLLVVPILLPLRRREVRVSTNYVADLSVLRIHLGHESGHLGSCRMPLNAKENVMNHEDGVRGHEPTFAGDGEKSDSASGAHRTDIDDGDSRWVSVEEFVKS